MEDLKPRPANSCPLTPVGFLDRAATAYSSHPSIVYNNTIHTWSQTHKRCLQLASSVSSVGIKRGDVVSVIAPNVPGTYELHFAVPMAGAVLNAINTRLDARTLSVQLVHSEAKLLFVDSHLKALVLHAISLFPRTAKPPLLVLMADEEYDHETSELRDVHFLDTYESMVKKGDPRFKWIRPDNEWDPLVLNYTSGTTSSPKGVVHSHRAVFIHVTNAIIDWSVPKHPVYLWTLPLFHSNGWNYSWGMAAVGGTNICLRRFDGPTIFRSIESHGVTHMCGAPVVMNMICNSTASNAKPLSPKVQILTGGAPPPAPVLSKAESLGFVVTHGYGLTEAGGSVVSCSWKREWDSLPATGRAQLKSRQGVRTIGLAGVDVISAETGGSVPKDGATRGEIVMRGACLMLGYLKDQEETSKCMRNDGWLYTGDVGVVHPDGYLEIKDRSKDVIISGGENVSSVEVETVLYSHPMVNEAAVVARPDEFWGETPCAFVSLKSKTKGMELVGAVEEELVEHCRRMLPHYMVPKTVVERDELPKTATGKIQKSVLRKMAEEMGSSRFSRM